LVVHGAVQGVGFRPFVFRLAKSLGLTGWVINNPGGVVIEVEGLIDATTEFLLRLEREKPEAAYLHGVEPTHLEQRGYEEFLILPSEDGGQRSAFVLPDLATCPECAAEIADPANRRYRYPFTNCTNCGPRYSIIESVPYDRPNTTMSGFVMCDACKAEYDNPADRRFHAQPNACPDCGPHLTLLDERGETVAERDRALALAASEVLSGRIVAVKGIGGFQLLVDASNEAAVQRLRERKRRMEKPFAVMHPSLAAVKRDCIVDEREERLLRSPQAPIVLLHRKREQHKPGVNPTICDAVAPGNPDLGVMLPYSPLHLLLMERIGRPVVATSGNISDEPICIDNKEALERLKGIADTYLVHDRPIARHVDDSVVRVVLGREMVLRRARGYAPLPIGLADSGLPILAVGAHQKGAVALAVGNQAVVSQHIGDLETLASELAFQRVIDDLSTMYGTSPAAIACDLHPDYTSTRYAHSAGLPIVQVQHHHAHILSCMADNQITGPVLGVAWDGSGFGPDGTVWGGEFLTVCETDYARFASLRAFRLPGGEKAVREPRRCALGALYEVLGEEAFTRKDLAPLMEFNDSNLKVLASMLRTGLNSPLTSSAGRLFDVVASLAGVRQTLRHEGQAAMELEFAARHSHTPSRYPVMLEAVNGPNVLDWEPMLHTLLADIGRQTPIATISRRFHNTLAYSISLVAEAAGIEKVVLSGGCFQNRLLTELTVLKLRDAGFKPFWHQRVPPNDGGIALGQLVAARAATRGSAPNIQDAQSTPATNDAVVEGHSVLSDERGRNN
jgi:hydrogenase maturation protein HypF